MFLWYDDAQLFCSEEQKREYKYVIWSCKRSGVVVYQKEEVGQGKDLGKEKAGSDLVAGSESDIVAEKDMLEEKEDTARDI